VTIGSYRWDLAVGFRGPEFLRFAERYFGDVSHRLLLIASAGFDPRSPRLAEHLARWAPGRVQSLLIREERPTSDAALRALANHHHDRLRAAVSTVSEMRIKIFDDTDLAVVGGRIAAGLVGELPLQDYTDIVVDLSALSIGVSFPLVRALLERNASARRNVHAVVVADAQLDAEIRPLPTEAATVVHGFRGTYGMDASEDASRLWLPQLAFGRQELLERVFEEVTPHDTCPILPFPAEDVRAGDALVEEHLAALSEAWSVDTRNIIYAAEDDPLDVYRTILELSDAREPVFQGHGGSLVVLTPIGSKVLALGALMAATERNFPVLHVEAVGFSADANMLAHYPEDRGTFAHVWLEGDAYTSTVEAA
jgi:hypothetical protein